MKRTLLLLIAIALVVISNACTTFFIHHNGQMVFGRNYDWISGSGMVCTNLRGLYKTSSPVSDGKTISWTSKYGSITFNQYGKEFPTGGMNENGLVVELMWLDDTRYPSNDDRPAIGVLQWIQYQLDNNATVDEVISSDSKLRITTTSAPLHYLVADAKGNAATIEFLNGKMIVHNGNSLPFAVLTNNTYSESKYYGDPGKSGGASIPDNSLQRFATACKMVKEFSEIKSGSAIEHAFNILGKVAQGNYTKWSIVYDLKNKSVRFKTADFPTIRSFDFSAFDFSCNAVSKVYNMNQSGKENISTAFIPFNRKINEQILNKSVQESYSRVPISDKERKEALDYPETINCNTDAKKSAVPAPIQK